MVSPTSSAFNLICLLRIFFYNKPVKQVHLIRSKPFVRLRDNKMTSVSLLSVHHLCVTCQKIKRKKTTRNAPETKMTLSTFPFLFVHKRKSISVDNLMDEPIKSIRVETDVPKQNRHGNKSVGLKPSIPNYSLHYKDVLGW